jgi:hypothetical protein
MLTSPIILVCYWYIRVFYISYNKHEGFIDLYNASIVYYLILLMCRGSRSSECLTPFSTTFQLYRGGHS